jgi:hypothetical protein
MSVKIDDAYYAETAKKVQSSPVDGFSALVAQHKADILAAPFREPAEEIFKKNLNWLAQQVVTQPGTTKFKEPADITDDDVRKLEILKAEYGFDYLQDIRIEWTTTKNNRRLPYKEPFLMYLASGKGDLTDYQTGIITKLIDDCNAAGKPWSLGINYCARSGRGTNHNDKKNIFHVLLEGELTPNKKKIADLIPDEVVKEIYQVYAFTRKWRGSYGNDEYKDYETYRHSLHSAVASGRIENVEYALSRGEKQTAVYNNTGSTAFADAVARNKEPAYHAIALRLLEDALAQQDGAKILNDGSRWDEDNSLSPIQQLARRGDIAFTLAIARATAGAPEMAIESFTYAEDVTPRGSHTVGAAAEAAKTEFAIKPLSGQDNPFLYIHQAVFNINPSGAFYGASQDIYGNAIKHLVDKGVLNEEQIPQDSLTDQRSLNFIFSLRAAADAEKRRNPDFLEKNADFTEGFTEEVRKASALTNNFRVIYDAERPEETSTRAYDDAGLSTGAKIAVKTLKLKKPSA